MNGWQVDLMVENDRNRSWEELNEPDQYDEVLKDAAKELEKALGYLDTSISRLYDASADLAETPFQARVDSVIDSLFDVQRDLQQKKELWERGDCA